MNLPNSNSTSELVVMTRSHSDEQVIAMWLHDRPKNTIDSYQRTVNQFREFLADKSLQTVVLEDVQRFITHLSQSNLAVNSRRQKINALKSLFSFATTLGYTRYNVMNVVKPPKAKHTLAGRILKPQDAKKLITTQTTARHAERNRIFITLMYATGMRVSEICGLTWGSFIEQTGGKIQATIVGKGDKTRHIVIPPSVWQELLTLKTNDNPDTLVFGFKRVQAHNIVKAANQAAGMDEKISCHYYRHGHASAALRNGAPLELVRDTLGHSNIAVTNAYLEAMPEDSSSNYLGF